MDNDDDNPREAGSDAITNNVRLRRPGVSPTTSNPLSSNTNASDTNNNAGDSKELPYKTSAEYCQALNQWMLQCYYWQCFQQISLPMATLQQATITASNGTPAGGVRFPNLTTDEAARRAAVENGRVYMLPKIWKRCAAEFIDFLLLLVLKVVVTYIAIDYFDLVDLAKYEINLLEEEFDAYQLAYELTSEILIIESIHRLLVVAFETVCLARAAGPNRGVGGSTPGKAIMGLKVISCTQLDDLGNGTIRVVPAGDIGFFWSLLRALIKNLSSVFFLPASLTIFVSMHNRAA